MSSITETNYIEVPGKSSQVNSIWHYFLKESTGATAKCKDPECKKPILKTSGGSTKGCRDHLKRIHNVDLDIINLTSVDLDSGMINIDNKCQHMYYILNTRKLIT